jgi:hypothetical protein
VTALTPERNERVASVVQAGKQGAKRRFPAFNDHELRDPQQLAVGRQLGPAGRRGLWDRAPFSPFLREQTSAPSKWGKEALARGGVTALTPARYEASAS